MNLELSFGIVTLQHAIYTIAKRSQTQSVDRHPSVAAATLFVTLTSTLQHCAMTTTETTTTDTTEETYQPSTVYHAPPHSHPPATPPPHPLGPYPRNDPRITYLCVFYHRLLDFRVPEAHAVLQLLAGEHGFELWPATQHPLTPYYYLRIDPVHIPAFTQRCMLVRVWLCSFCVSLLCGCCVTCVYDAYTATCIANKHSP